MDIGADLFLQMMKGIYPGYLYESTEKYREWFQKGVFAMDSEVQSNMMQRILQTGDLYVKFMNTVLEASEAAWAGEGSGDKLNEIYNKISQNYFDFYKGSVGKYLGTPQFGIPREALQQIMIAVDSYHKFMGAVGDFVLMFSTPLKKSMEILQQKIKNKEESDDSFQTAKEVYNFIVSILDKEYDHWLKSPEGVKSVVSMVEKYLEYKQASNPVKDIWLKSLSIPTKREMEDVYRGIYDLKKKTRKQDAMIREQNEIIKTLNQKIHKFEIAISDSSHKKKASASISVPQEKKSKSSAGPKKKAKVL